MENKLKYITPTYRSFEPNQVLTSDQLNEFLDYFDDQDRLSRIFLSGTGIASGFKLKYDNSNGAKLEITQGAGVTTDGDLINFLKGDGDGEYSINCDPRKFMHYRVFNDAGNYQPYFYEANGIDQLQLFELLTADEASGAFPLSDFTNPGNMVVLLYLETYEDFSDACTGVDCDNLGVKHVRKLRVLLTTKANADLILAHDHEFEQHYLMSTYLGLSDIVIQRVTVDDSNSATFADLRTSYLNAMQAENIIDKLKISFETMLQKLGMQNDATAITSQLTTLFGANASIPQAYFQYRYDLLRDVTDAYNEMKELFLDAVCCCCPDITSFPKHLMLGVMNPTEKEIITQPYRHSFYKSPILSCDGQCTDYFKSLVKRVRRMLEQYVATETLPVEIKITPSRLDAILSQKAIPYYYDFNQSLLLTWNYEKTMRNKYRRNLSYRTALLEQTGAIQYPLNYNLEPFNHLRIEGTVGNQYQVALDKVSELRDQYGLAFDVKAINIQVNSTDTINIADYDCEFADLNLMLEAWTQEHECLLGKVSRYFSAFSTLVPGLNYLEEEYYYPTSTAVQITGNAVYDQAYNAPGALGKILVQKFDAFRGCSGRDISAQVDRELAVVPASPIKEASLLVPAQILSFAYVLLQKRPLKLPDVTTAVISTVNTNVESLCSSARVGLTKFPAAEAQGLSQRSVRMLTTLTTDLTALCCSAEKLQVIHDEMEKRKQQILLGLNLKKFQEQHPGMEHFAGTKQGGTYIMVYVGSQTGSIPPNTVVADFMLPYLCCSDCRSVSFLMPRPAVSLSLSNEVYTIGESTSPIEIFATPADGFVSFSPAVPGITVNGNQLLVEDDAIPDWAIGQPISFTLNQQYTNAKLTIFRAVPVTIDANVDTDYVTTNDVTFGVSAPDGNLLQNYTFAWDFGDGSTSSEKSPTHVYNLPLPGNKALVKLTATPPNGASPSVSSRTLFFAQPSANMSKTVFCDNDSTGYEISITPPSAVVNLSGPGVVKTGNAYYFYPISAGAGQPTIILNGNPVLKLEVRKTATASFKATVSGTMLVLSASIDPAIVASSSWILTDNAGNEVYKQMYDVSNVEIPFANINVAAGQDINIKLTVVNKGDCGSSSATDKIQKPDSSATCNLESRTVLTSLRNALNDILKNDDGWYGSSQQTGIDALSFYDDVAADFEVYQSGSVNSFTGNTFSGYLNSLFIDITNAVSEGQNPERMASVYLNILDYGILLLRCQAEDVFMNTEIQSMFNLVIGQTDPTDNKSLQSLGVNVNPEGSTVQVISIAMSVRTNGSGSWSLLNTLLQNIQPADGSDV